jgi:hypothetical protein
VTWLNNISLNWTPLNVLKYHSGFFTSYVERNAQLVPDRATNPAFQHPSVIRFGHGRRGGTRVEAPDRPTGRILRKFPQPASL